MCEKYFDDKRLKFPNYDKSILSTITSILNYYGVDNSHVSLNSVNKIIQKKYKNVVLLILDGMGEHILNVHDKKGFFKCHEIDCVTSVYPSTTTAAMTTYYSGKCPLETGWIAWSQYFKEYGRVINMLPGTEAYTGEKLKVNGNDVFRNIVNYKTVYEMIEEKRYKAYEVAPSHVERRWKRTFIGDNLEETCAAIKDLCEIKEEKFILAYLDNPDQLIHKYGTDSLEVKEFILDAEEKIKDLSDKVKDTLLIISADHGHKDIEKVYSILDYPELRDCLIMPEFFESRFVGFWVKENRCYDFEKIFKKEFDDFILLKAEEVLEYGLLGCGNKHKKVEDFLGNYIALSTGSSIFRIQNDYFEGKKVKKSTHCGLTKEEMEVPVIVLENK